MRAPTLKVATHNVRGLLASGGSMAKVASLVRLWSNHLKLDIVILQETHLNPAQEGEAERQLRMAATHHRTAAFVPFWNSLPQGGKEGVAILVSERLLSSDSLSINRLSQGGMTGRFLGARIRWGGHYLALAAVYVPSGSSSRSQAQRDFLAGCLGPWLQDRGRALQLIGGDFNFVLDSALDRRSQREADPHLPPLPARIQSPTLSPSDRTARELLEAVAARPLSLPHLGSGSERLTAGLWEGICSEYGLVDPFRTLHARKRGYTWHRGDQASRIDRFHAHLSLQPFVERCFPAKGDRSLSDHSPLVIHLRASAPPPSQVAKGPARLRLSTISGEAQWEALHDVVSACARGAPLDNPHTMLAWWPTFKAALTTQVSALCKALRASKRDRHRGPADPPSLTGETQHSEDLRSSPLHGNDQERPSSWERACQASAQFDDHPNYHGLRHSWVHEGERPSPLMSALLTPPQQSRLIPALQTPTGAHTSSGKDMAEIAVSHYAKISASAPTDPDAQRAVLDSLKAHARHLDKEQSATAGHCLVKEEEVLHALKRSSRGKAPGPDGIPVELWTRCRSTMAPLLAALYSAIGYTGCTPAGFLDGMVTPLHKGGEKSQIVNYRPITLLNTDYRLLTNCLANRWGPALASAIGPEQTAFLPGRLMGESISLLQLLPHALRAQQGGRGGPGISSGAAAFLDFQKAYDTVARGFLYEAIEAVGGAEVPDPEYGDGGSLLLPKPPEGLGMWDGVREHSARKQGMLGWARTLLRDTQASAVVNGHTSSPRTWEAGVRQGCPLAPAMYLFVAWALSSWLKSVPEIGITLSRARLWAVQYADDCVVLLPAHDERHLSALISAMDTFAAATGQQLNLSKCKVLPLGAIQEGEALPTHVCGIPISPTAATLGIVFDNNTASPHPPPSSQRSVVEVQAALHARQQADREELHTIHREQLRPLQEQHQSERSAVWSASQESGRLPQSQQDRLLERAEQEDIRLGTQHYLQSQPIQAAQTAERRQLHQLHQSQRDQISRQVRPPPTLRVTSQGANWDPLLSSALSKTEKLAKMSLSSFGRAFGAGGYALSKLLFHAEFAGLPEAVATQLQRATISLVETGSPGQEARGGLPSALMYGSPKEGGMGLMHVTHHVTARHAVWARRLMRALAAPAGPATPPWVLAASAILDSRSAVHPTLQLLPDQQYPPTPRPPPPLPGPLARWAQALQALGPPNYSPLREKAPDAWLLDQPVWGNPAFKIERGPAWRGTEQRLLSLLPARSSLQQVVNLLQGDRHPHQGRTHGEAAAQREDIGERVMQCLPPAWAAFLDQSARGTVNPDRTSRTTTTAGAINVILSRTCWGTPSAPLHQDPMTLASPMFTVKSVTHHLLLPSRRNRLEAWQACTASAASLYRPEPPSSPRPAAQALAQSLPRRLQQAWRLRWDNKWKELWYRLLQQGVRGAGGHGWGMRLGTTCACGWSQDQTAPSPARATQVREHVFWGCTSAQAIRRTLQHNLPTGVRLQAHHVWLLEPPAPSVQEEIWFAVALAALHAMHKAWRSTFSPETPDLELIASSAVDTFEAALKDFAHCQGLSSNFSNIGESNPFLQSRPNGSLAASFNRL